MSPRPKPIKTFPDFVDYILKNCDGKNRIYRGQSVDRDLTPKIGRIRLHGKTSESEGAMFQDFKRKVIPFLDQGKKSELELLAVAQHHGMATRLLDWSENPFVALWFVVESPPRSDTDGNPEDGAFWILDTEGIETITDTDDFEPLDIQRTLLYQPRHIAQRIIGQSGLFSLHHLDSKTQKHVPLNKNPLFKTKLTKLTIPHSSFFELRKGLDRFGFNPATIFPDIEGICRNAQWQHSYLDDEGIGRARTANGHRPQFL